MWKSRFTHDVPKTCLFNYALLLGKARFLMTCQKRVYLLLYYSEKQDFSLRAKNVLLMLYYLEKQVLS